jgi:hypothetical protein
VEDLRRIGREADHPAISKVFVWWGGFRGWATADEGGLLIHHFEQWKVVFIEEDGRSGEALEAKRAADVVNVGVGDDDLFKLESKSGEAVVDAGDLVARIDDDGLSSCFVAEQGAVALQRADGKAFEDHGIILELERADRRGPAEWKGQTAVDLPWVKP